MKIAAGVVCADATAEKERMKYSKIHMTTKNQEEVNEDLITS